MKCFSSESEYFLEELNQSGSAESPLPVRRPTRPRNVRALPADTSSSFHPLATHSDSVSPSPAFRSTGKFSLGDDPTFNAIFKERRRSPVAEAVHWLVSLLFHVVLLFPLLFLCVSGGGKKILEVIAQPGLTEELGLLDVYDDQSPDLELPDLDIAPVTMEAPMTEIHEAVTFSPDDSAAMSSLPSDFGFDPVPVGDLTNLMGKSIGHELEGRGKNKQALIASGGGSEGSERAVALALAWLAEHQLSDGSWTFDPGDHPNCRGRCQNAGGIGHAPFGATGLALLPFLGAGNTPYEGKYKDNVRRGIQFLIKQGVKIEQGLSYMDNGTMYSHGLCAIVLCETYTMLPPIERSKLSGLNTAMLQSLAFIENAQDPSGGGWRYRPRQAGDTSVVGWQIMALKSAQIGKVKVQRVTFQRALNFLVNVTGSSDGTEYGYTISNSGVSPATCAIGLLCRLFLDWRVDNYFLLRGADALLENGPLLGNPYFNYYATQLFHHIGGERWKKWNEMMRDPLISQQVLEGHEKGSWFPNNADGHCRSGGRLYATALNCMILEVYYRHLPLYQKEVTEEAFPLD